MSLLIYRDSMLLLLTLPALSGASRLAKTDEILSELKPLVQKTMTAEPEYYAKKSINNQQVWETYYDCLEKQLELTNIQRAVAAVSVSVLEGGTARLDCQLCLSPDLLEGPPVAWLWSGEPLPEDDWATVDRRTGRLALFGVRSEQAGLYECRRGGAASSLVFLLHVIRAAAGLRLVRGPRAEHGALPQDDRLLTLPKAELLLFSEEQKGNGLGLKIVRQIEDLWSNEKKKTLRRRWRDDLGCSQQVTGTTKSAKEGGWLEHKNKPPVKLKFQDNQHWSPWSECSRCGEVGKHYKFGACTVRLVEDTVEVALRLKTQGGWQEPMGNDSRSRLRNAERAQVRRRNKAIAERKRAETNYIPERKYPEVMSLEKGNKRRKRMPTEVRRWGLKGIAKKFNKEFKSIQLRGLAKEENKLRHSVTADTSGEVALNAVGVTSTTTRRHVKYPGYLTEYELLLLGLVVHGLPCNSELLSQELRSQEAIAGRENEMMEAFCKPPCEDDIFEVKNSLGEVLERVNNSAGLFSSLQGPPPLPPIPSRDSVFVPIGQRLEISCPGHLHHDVPFYWTVNRTCRIYPRLIARQSGGRVKMDYRQRLIFREVEPGDSKLYVCWQLGSIAGVVRVVVYDPSSLGLDHHVMFLGLTVILGTFVYLFAKIYANRKKAAVA